MELRTATISTWVCYGPFLVSLFASDSGAGSSLFRGAKLEASDPTASVDLPIRRLLAAGASKKDIASAIAGGNQGGPAEPTAGSSSSHTPLPLEPAWR